MTCPYSTVQLIFLWSRVQMMSPEGRNQGSVCPSTADGYLRHCNTCLKLMEFPVLKKQSETWKEEELQRVQVEMCYGRLNSSQKFTTLRGSTKIPQQWNCSLSFLFFPWCLHLSSSKKGWKSLQWIKILKFLKWQFSDPLCPLSLPVWHPFSHLSKGLEQMSVHKKTPLK